MNTDSVEVIARQSRLAARKLSATPESLRNLALSKMAESLESVRDSCLKVRGRQNRRTRDVGKMAEA